MMPTLPEFLHEYADHLDGRQECRPYKNGFVGTPFMASAIRIAIIVAFFLILAALAIPAHAQDGAASTVTDDQVNAIAQKLFCPVCENITLDTCPTAACADWRYEIRLQLEAGLTEEQIVEDFVRRFGDRVVGTPLDPTLRAVSLVTPWLIIAAALIAVVLLLARRKPAQPAPVATEDAPANRYQDLFEQDIRST